MGTIKCDPNQSEDEKYGANEDVLWGGKEMRQFVGIRIGIDPVMRTQKPLDRPTGFTYLNPTHLAHG